MPENQTAMPQHAPIGDEEISLLGLLIVLAKHKKMIVGITFIAALIAAGISLLMPKIYTGKAQILPPQQNQSSTVNAIMLAQLGGLAGAAGTALGLKDTNALYVAMLKSHNIMEKIARRFNLQAVYEEETMTDALKTLKEKSNIEAGKDGVISVEVDDKDPQLAAAMANAYIEELNKLMQTFALTEAAQRRQFYETQLKPAKDKLTDAEILLDKTPNTSLQYLGALRNLKYQEMMFDILARQFEMAKLDEAKDSPLIQVLDKATPPEKKSKPKRSLIVIMATFVAFFLSAFWAFVLESRQQSEQAEQMQALRNAFKWRA